MTRALRITALITLVLALIVVVIGAYVRLSDAGLGCPDWPLCYGQPLPGEIVDRDALARAWKEMGHRYLAGTLGFLIVLAPLFFATYGKYAPWLLALERQITFWRYGIAGTVIVIALVVAHKWLPAGKRSFKDIAPGVIVTLVLWLAAGVLFGRYLAEFANNYVTMYAGLASAMIALVFLYWTATIFVYGGELNAAILRRRERKLAEERKAREAAAAEAEVRRQSLFAKTMRLMGYEKRRR